MSTLYELQKYVEDALYKKHMFEVKMKQLNVNYKMPVLTQLSNLELDENKEKILVE